MRERRRRFQLRSVGAALAAAGALAILGAAPAAANPLDGQGMWIWYVSKAGGSADAIASKAKQYGIDTVLIKSSDGTSPWSQFSSNLIAGLHHRNLNVCAWQFVYGSKAKGEAQQGARAVRKGADCLVIDAEGQYEGRYKAARQYMTKLRNEVGDNYPLGLAGFPYVNFHRSFPYSIFLGKNGAQNNVPQMYWHTIGTSVKHIFSHTYKVNAAYKRPIYPLGQTYADPPRKQILDFRQTAKKFNAHGVSWWSWQNTSKGEWKTLSQPLSGSGSSGGTKPHKAATGTTAPAGYPALGVGSRGDLVVQAQELLLAWNEPIAVSGIYDDATAAAVRDFQAHSGLAVTGSLDDATWPALLERRPVSIKWGSGSAKRGGVPNAPASASLPTERYEIPPTAGHP